jgi:exonuclease III
MTKSAISALLVGLSLLACSAGQGVATGESEIGTRPPRAWTPSPPKDGNLRIATFNIRNFPVDVMGAPPGSATDGGATDGGATDTAAAPDTDTRPHLVRRQEDTDIGMLVDLLDRLDFDVLAVQEINDTERFDAALAELGARHGRTYDSTYSLAWDHPQHVGLVVRTDHARIEAPQVHGEIATRPTMRAGLSARITSTRPGGVDFGILVLHLASGDTSGRATLRAEQASHAAEVVAARQAEFGDDDFVVVGDMNTAREEREFPGLDAAMAGAGGGGGGKASGLTRQATELGCTSYYVKGPNVPLLEPAWIDQVYLASMTERDSSVPVTAGAHCYERSCRPFESDAKDTGTSYWGVSDHCPVYFEITDEDRD